MTMGKSNWIPNYGTFQSFQVFGIFFACVFISIFLIIKNKFKIYNFKWSLVFLFLFLPYVFALGTSNNYWAQGTIASFFWLTSGFVLIIPLCLKFKTYQPIVFLVLLSQLIASIHIKERIEDPYRNNQPLNLNKSEMMINDKGHTLIISYEFARYINDSRNVSINAGFKKGTPMIDLTGQSPGLLYLMQAKSIGRAWIMGGYVGSMRLAKGSFNLVDCKDIANAWILYEKNGPISISAELLTSLGANFPSQYSLMGTWRTAKGAGGYKEKRVQMLYKPKDISSVINSCNLLRVKK